MSDGPISPGPQDRAYDNDDEDKESVTEHDEHRSGASADKGPTQSESGTGEQMSLDIQLHRRIGHQGIVQCFHFGPFHDRNGDRPHDDRDAYDAVHMDTFKSEHLMDPVP